VELNLHYLALQLHLPVAELTERLSLGEYRNWLRYFAQVNAGQNKAPAEVDWSDPATVAQVFGG
jgi:hypothetical protein